MKLHELTHNDAGEDVAPRSPDDVERWNDWVSATKLRGYLLGNTLGDWLHLYGEEHGFRRDPPLDERLDLRRFNMKQGMAFEDCVANYLAQRADLVRITTDGHQSRDLEKVKATAAALEAGREVLHAGVLWNPETRTYGIPDFLIRSDVFDRLFPDHPDPYSEADNQTEVGRRDVGLRYVVVDAKFTTLRLFAEPGRRPKTARGIDAGGDQQRRFLSGLQGATLPLQRGLGPSSEARAAPGLPAGPRVGTGG